MTRLAIAAICGLWLLSGFAGEASAQTLSAFCEKNYRAYKASRGAKAFATGTDGSCWWGYGKRDLAAAQSFAVGACRRNGRPGCRVVESSF